MTEQATIDIDIATTRRVWAALEALWPGATRDDIAAATGASPDAVEAALLYLEQAGVVEPWADREGRRVLVTKFSVTRY